MRNGDRTMTNLSRLYDAATMAVFAVNGVFSTTYASRTAIKGGCQKDHPLHKLPIYQTVEEVVKTGSYQIKLPSAEGVVDDGYSHSVFFTTEKEKDEPNPRIILTVRIQFGLSTVETYDPELCVREWVILCEDDT
jgi:predicted SAM-dependent methyltransferase